MQTKKVFVVKKFHSPYVEQAIFILREDAPCSPPLSGAVQEAERIVNEYLDTADFSSRPKSKKHTGLLCLGFCALFLAAVCVIRFCF